MRKSRTYFPAELTLLCSGGLDITLSTGRIRRPNPAEPRQLVLHLSAFGATADLGKLPVDRPARANKSMVRRREDRRPQNYARPTADNMVAISCL
jgi:hypothetical protein